MPVGEGSKEVGEQASDRRLWLIRHGETTWNASGVVQGQKNEPSLTPLGVCQARASAQRLVGRPLHVLVSSDLQRAVETSTQIAEILHTTVEFDPRLRERSMGLAEGELVSSVRPSASGLEGGRVIDADVAPQRSESVRAFYARVVTAGRDLVARPGNDDVVAVCHGGVICVLLAWFDGVGPDAMTFTPVTNGDVISRPIDGSSGVGRLAAPD